MSAPPDIAALMTSATTATGSDLSLDRQIAAYFGEEGARPYTSSVEDCVRLVERVLPDWAWHVGWSADGILPYATLRHDHRLIESSAPTVPLALVRVLIRAKQEELER